MGAEFAYLFLGGPLPAGSEAIMSGETILTFYLLFLLGGLLTVTFAVGYLWRSRPMTSRSRR